MALGFGFNKTKVLASAEKYVQQGKLANAISEYQKVLKEDPKDWTVLNTVGDLHARLGQADQAIVAFKKVGDSYAHDGFTVKAIAMFKKITKLSPGDAEVVQRLAELYTQQGLFNDARAQYMQLADAHVRGSRFDDATKVFQKMLELDPENATVQSKLADLYVRLGKVDDAKNIFLTAAQSLYIRGSLPQADEALSRILSLDPHNPGALQLRGQVAIDAGKPADAVRYLENIADIDSRPDALQTLLKARVALGEMNAAEPIARKLLSVHNDISGIITYADALMNAGECEAALRVYDDNADRLLSTNAATTMSALNKSISKIKENSAALAILYSLARRSGETTHLAETMELLAHAYVHDEQFEKARDLYKELSVLEPENPTHAQNYRQMLAKLGDDAAVRPLTDEEASRAALAGELDLPEPTLVQEHPHEVEEAIKAALTDAELHESYNVAGKAIPALEHALQSAPDDVRLNYRLTLLYARAGRHADAAAAAQVLHDVFKNADKREESERYGQLAAQYRAAAGIQEAPAMSAAEPAASAMPEFVIDGSAPAMPAEFTFESVSAPEPVAQAAPEPAVMSVEEAPAPPAPAVAAAPTHEIDLSDEWQVEVEGGETGGDVNEILDEARFYLSQGMLPEARFALDRAATNAPQNPDVAALRAQIEASESTAAPVAPPAVSEFVFDQSAVGETAPGESVDVPPIDVPVVPQTAAFEVPVVEEAAASMTDPFAAAEAASIGEQPAIAAEHMAASPEVSLEMPVEEPPAAAPPAAAAAPSGKDILDGFALDLADSLPEDFSAPLPPAGAARPTPPPPIPAAPVQPAAAAAAAAPAVQNDVRSALSDIFDEFKEEVETGQTEEEDPMTHYNLGVAFKEMALLDEAIGEFQKVCSAMDKGQPFAEPVQVYTMLAGCFAEKGVPEVSTKWLLKALSLPNLDEDAKLALHYEIGTVSESAGDKQTALKHFMEVYGSNIDYRDVAERIKALRA